MSLFWVEAPEVAGRVGVMLPPRGGQWLPDDAHRLSRAGVHRVVSALTPGEERLLWLEDERHALAGAGVHFTSLPIGNLGTPTASALQQVLVPLAMEVARGLVVVTHCRASVGRGPLLAATLLVLNRVSAPDAWERVERARGLRVPDTNEQRDWVHALARSHGLLVPPDPE